MKIKVYPGQLHGIAEAPPSKSMAHRALICAALADGTSEIKGVSDSRDMEATIGCLRELGAEITRSGRTAVVKGIAGRFPEIDPGKPYMMNPRLDCIESGSTLRFLLPVAAALGRETSFSGTGKLPGRPMTPLTDEMKKKGIRFLPGGRDSLPFIIKGQLEPGIYEIPGNVSSQYISGLIFALPLLAGDSEIHVKGELESASYVDLTIQSAGEFGISVEKTAYGYAVRGGQKYSACDTEVEGDYSNAAFWIVAGACAAGVAGGIVGRFMGAFATPASRAGLLVAGLREHSAQGDRRIIGLLGEAGARIESHAFEGFIQYGIDPARLHGTDIDCSDIPDIVPALAVAATAAEGVTRFYNAGRLRLKESDRLAAMADCLHRLGADVREEADELYVRGGQLRGGCEINGYNDHRIVMAMAVAGLICSEPVIINGAEAVDKSYPDFFDVFRRLGGRADVINYR